jgi:hypothetical protein
LPRLCKRQVAWLEVIVTIARLDKPFRVAVISNFPRPNESQRAKKEFSVRVHRITKPLFMVSGYLPCIEGHDRRRLAALARNLDPASGVAAKRLQEINRSAAKRSNGLVSEDCWVTHQTVEAGSIRTAGVNVGQRPVLYRCFSTVTI